MNVIGKSMLLGKKVRLAGFGNEAHPWQPGEYICLSLYQLESKAFVLCLSSGAGDGDPGLKPEGLDGKDLPAEAIIPYVQRYMEDRSAAAGQEAFQRFRKVLEESYPLSKFQWIDPSKLMS